MFTGIVEAIGEVTLLERRPASARIAVRSVGAFVGLSVGDSVAVNGVCLTATSESADEFEADVMQSTLDATTLGELVVGGAVNLETAARFGDPIGGHLVQGHVDGVAVVRDAVHDANWTLLSLRAPGELVPLVAPKGSVALDGVSLTVVRVDDEEGAFEVSLIPETLARTTLGTARAGTRLNLETDMMARQVRRLLQFGGAP